MREKCLEIAENGLFLEQKPRKIEANFGEVLLIINDLISICTKNEA
jgi:hypothetical protein